MSTLDLGKLKFLWRGTWAPSSTYVANDLVAYNSGVWICTQNHATGVSTEFSPGKRDRANALGKTIDPSEVISIQVTVASGGSSNYFYLDGRLTPSITIYPNTRYRFYQKDSSNTAHRIAFSTTQDGYFTTGGAEYTTGVTFYGTPGVDGYVDVVLNSNAPTTLYYFSATDIGYGGGATGKLTVTPAWRGYQYWDQVTSGFSFKGTWIAGTQFYYNDIIEYQGATYLALADSIGKEPTTPTNSHFWLLMIPGDRRTEHHSAAWFMNKGPIDWPYNLGQPANNGNGNHLAAAKWISRSGRVYNHGSGNNYNHGMQAAVVSNDQWATIGHPQEIVFNHTDWWSSRDNGGTGRLTTPDGMPPKCIQIEAGIDWAIYLFNNGEVWNNGFNTNGELGTGDTTTQSLPRRVVGLSDVKIVKVSSGYGPATSGQRHVLALDDQGYVWVWGYNNTGQLGNGNVTSQLSAQRLPRSYFGGEKVIDIIAVTQSGNTSHWSYARVASDNLYAWGYNGNYQLGLGDTTNRYRPVKMVNWDPVANSGIKKLQVWCGISGAGSLMILDGLGYLWHTGSDPVGHAGFAVAAQRTQLTKTTVTPNGSIVNFWNVWSSDTTALAATFIRHANGSTYVCGQASLFCNTQGTNGNSAAILLGTGASVISSSYGTSASTGLINIKEVYLHISYTSDTRRTIHWLRDDGKVFAQGNNGAGEYGNPFAGVSASVTGTTGNYDESGTTTFPTVVYTPPSHKVVQILPMGSGSTDLNWQHGMFYLLSSGQILASGMPGNSAALGVITAPVRWSGGNFLGVQPHLKETAYVNQPLTIHYAR